jgi:hypothetical protein
MNMIIDSPANESVEVVTERATQLLADLEHRLPAIGELYRDLHRHPELSMQEHRTAGIVARHLLDAGYEVTDGVGRTGVVDEAVCPSVLSSFMNIRVADIQACYKLWKSRGAEFLTEPLDKHGETRCYILKSRNV